MLPVACPWSAGSGPRRVPWLYIVRMSHSWSSHGCGSGEGALVVVWNRGGCGLGGVLGGVWPPVGASFWTFLRSGPLETVLEALGGPWVGLVWWWVGAEGVLSVVVSAERCPSPD